MLSTASKYPKKNLDCSLTLQNLSKKKRLNFESDVYHFDKCPRLLGLKIQNCVAALALVKLGRQSNQPRPRNFEELRNNINANMRPPVKV